VRDNRHDSVPLFGAICPARGVGAAIIMPAVNTEAMNEHPAEIRAQLAPGAPAVAILDVTAAAAAPPFSERVRRKCGWMLAEGAMAEAAGYPSGRDHGLR